MIEEYGRMAAAGILSADERLELLQGDIVCMAAISPHLAACVTDLNAWFGGRLRGRATVRVHSPIHLPSRSQPAPNIAIVRYREDSCRHAHPGPDDVLLLIEVAAASPGFDRDCKLPLYAAAGIPEVWIADLDGDRVLVYRLPRGKKYTNISVVERGGTLSPAAFPELTLSLDDVLGPAS